MALHWIFALIFAFPLALASPGSPAPACGGNPCYPILAGPVLRDIAKDFCSYYLHYPKTTTVTVKTTSTLTNTYTIAGKTATATATTKKVISTTTTSTSTIAGQTFTSTTTETVTAKPVKKREANPAPWAPPKGSGDGYKPPALAPFPAAQVSSACSCIVTPTTKTFTTTVTVTATATKTATPVPVTTTAATVTNTESVTVTVFTTVTSNPTTTIVTSTTTIPAPAEECGPKSGPFQSGVRGTYDDSNPAYLASTRYALGFEGCRDFCTAQRNPRDPTDFPAQSFTWKSDTEPGTPNGGEGFCICWKQRLCNFFQNDPNGFAYGGDIRR